MRKLDQLTKVVDIIQMEKVITYKDYVKKYGKEFSSNATAVYWLRMAVKQGLVKTLRITRHYVLLCVEYEYCIERMMELIKKAMPCILDLYASAKSKCITIRSVDLSSCLSMPVANELANWILAHLGELVKQRRKEKWYRICRKI